MSDEANSDEITSPEDAEKVEIGIRDREDAAYWKGLEEGRPRWVPVSNGPPEQGIPVLALCHSGGYQFQSVCYWHGGWRAAESGAPCDAVKITHFMPLPEPPKP